LDTATEEERAGERSFEHVIFAPYMFPSGAMPKVFYLEFGLLVSDILSGGDWDLCIRNLPSLKNVSIKLHGEEESSERYSEAKAAVPRQASFRGPQAEEVRTTFAQANVCACLFPCTRILLMRTLPFD
jgi:hypothetical protein